LAPEQPYFGGPFLAKRPAAQQRYYSVLPLGLRPGHLLPEEKGSAEFFAIESCGTLEGPYRMCTARIAAVAYLDSRASSESSLLESFLLRLDSNTHTTTANMSPGITLFSVQAVLILSCEDGSRILAKYYNAPHSAPSTAGTTSSNPGTNPYPDLKSQKAFEKGLIDKTAKQTGDIILYDNRIVLYKLESDVMIYVVGNSDDNEILLYNTVLAIRDSLHLLFK
jgi:hypothetical protein